MLSNALPFLGTSTCKKGGANFFPLCIADFKDSIFSNPEVVCLLLGNNFSASSIGTRTVFIFFIFRK